MTTIELEGRLIAIDMANYLECIPARLMTLINFDCMTLLFLNRKSQTLKVSVDSERHLFHLVLIGELHHSLLHSWQHRSGGAVH